MDFSDKLHIFVKSLLPRKWASGKEKDFLLATTGTMQYTRLPQTGCQCEHGLPMLYQHQWLPISFQAQLKVPEQLSSHNTCPEFEINQCTGFLEPTE